MIRTVSLGLVCVATRSAVIILVRLAIGTTSVGFLDHSTWPVLTSNSSPLFSGRLSFTLTCSAAGAAVIP